MRQLPLETATTMKSAATADSLGYDSPWVADHLFLGRDDAILEGRTTLGPWPAPGSRRSWA